MSRSKFDVAAIAVRNDDGTVNVDETVAFCFQEVQKYADLQSADQEKIREAMLSLYSDNPKMVLNVPALITLTATKVGFTGSSHGALVERIHETLKATPEIVVERGPGKGARLRSSEELAYFQEHGTDMPTAKKNSNEAKIAKLQEKLSKLQGS